MTVEKGSKLKGKQTKCSLDGLKLLNFQQRCLKAMIFNNKPRTTTLALAQRAAQQRNENIVNKHFKKR